MFNVLRHLMPSGRAFSSTIDKTLRSFLTGVSAVGDDVKTALDTDYDELQPSTTNSLKEWEAQFGLANNNLSTAIRRTRLDAAWKSQGGQSPSYIQETLRAAGFDVYVHEWWEPGTEPEIGTDTAATPRNPLLYLREDTDTYYSILSCGDELAECGEDTALCGYSSEPTGYALVNIVPYSAPKEFVYCGEEIAACGEDDALCGNSLSYEVSRRVYTIPNDETKWPYFLYIGGETFGDFATISSGRKLEFETLCLKICPLHLWLGILVNYS